MSTLRLVLQFVILLCATTLWQQPTWATDTETNLRIATANLNSWLGADEKARQWRKVLHLNVLDAQAALGNRADISALQNIANAFNALPSSIDHPVFNQVKAAIEAHLRQLPMNNLAIDYEANRLMGTFEKPDLTDFDEMRAKAIYRIKMLKKYCKANLRSRERALLYYDIRPDETIQYLTDIEFELAPERSRTAIRQEINALEEQIETIDKKIEELNQQRDRIEKWIDGVQRPDNLEPPMPDDDETENDDGISPTLETEANRSTQANAPSDEQRQQIEQIEKGQMLLSEKKQDLQQQIDQLEIELKELTANEKKRSQRLRAQLKTYNQFLDKWQKTALRRNDSYFAQAYSSLTELKSKYLSAANPGTPKSFEAKLKEVIELNGRVVSNPSDRPAIAKLGNVTGWLEDAGQGKNLVASIRNRYSKPNLYFELSNKLVNQLTSRNVSEYRRVNEQVLSRLIRGIAKIDGDVTVQFSPDPYQVRAAIDFTGKIDSDTFARTGKLTAYAGANAGFNVRRDIFANVGGMFAFDIYGDLNLDSYFKCIDSNCQLVQKIARKQYLKSKALSESISTERTKSQVFPEFKKETNTAIESGFERFEQLSRQHTDYRNLVPSVYMHTTNDCLVLVGHKATAYDLAAPSEPQTWFGSRGDVELKINETAFSNYISPLLAGKKLSNTEIMQRVQQFTGEESVNQDEEEFSILFDDARPVQIEFENNNIAVTVSGKEFVRDGRRIRDGLRIRASFRFVNAGTHLTLEPAGEIEVELMDPTRKNIATVSFKSFLQDRLNDAIGEADFDGLEIPSNLLPTDDLPPGIKTIAQAMRLVQFRIESGWLYVGWNYVTADQFASYSSDTPAIGYPTAAPSIDASTPDDKELDLSDQLENSEISSE